MKILKVLTVLILGLHLTEAKAWGNRKIGVQMPTDATQFQGAFEGEQNGQSVVVLVSPSASQGSFIVSVFAKDPQAQLFYAELVDERTLGLFALGLKADQSDVDDKAPPAALMKIVTDQSNKIETIQITPQDGVQYLKGLVNLNQASGDYGVGGTLPQGVYKGEKHADVKLYQSADGWSLSGNIPSLGLSNDYSLTLALTDVGVLKAEALQEYLEKKEQNQISALVIINITKNGKPALLVLKANPNGASTSAVVLTHEE